MSADNYEPLLNDAQAAAFLGGLQPKTIQRMARRGELPAFRIGRYYRYRASELDAWLRGQVVNYFRQGSTRVNSEETIQ